MSDECSMQKKQMKQFFLQYTTITLPVIFETKNIIISLAFFSFTLSRHFITCARKQKQKKTHNTSKQFFSKTAIILFLISVITNKKIAIKELPNFTLISPFFSSKVKTRLTVIFFKKILIYR